MSTQAADRDIAITAIACRFPGGVRSAGDLWRLVEEGRCVVEEFPAPVRGVDLPMHAGPFLGGFLDEDVHEFDAAGFGLSPREAQAMDPQQRLMLALAAELVLRAGLDRNELKGRPVGVYCGVMAQEYGPRLLDRPDHALGYGITGTSIGVLPGRIAYHFGLRGPAVALETACSSSLVALDAAVSALRSGTCEMALAGGVCVMPTPGLYLDFSRQGGLSPDGRCKAFAAGADGTAWSEGAGLLLLEPLSRAREAGREVLAVIEGTAVNQDGASNGLTAPSRQAQQQLIERALADAGVDATEVGLVEAHGTGTPLGDPIEAGALSRTYGRATRTAPLWLGSLKSNIGHTQAAAGVGGVIKMVQALRNASVPRTLHVDRPSEHVDWAGSGLALATEAHPWVRQEDRPLRCAVSAFGIGGTNAHVILREGDGQVPEAIELRPSAMAVRIDRPADASRLAAWARTAEQDQVRRAVSAYNRASRAPTDESRVVVADTRAELLLALADVAAGRPYHTPSAGWQHMGRSILPLLSDAPDPVLVMPGQGSQWHGMADALLAESAAFRQAFGECCAQFGEFGVPDLATLAEDDLTRVDVVQPMLFAMMTSLARAVEDLGVRPRAVIGTSQGEIAAAYVAGALSLPDACRVVALRSRALIELGGHGGLLSLRRSSSEVGALLRDRVIDAEVAAHNGPQATLVGGAEEALDQVAAAAEARGWGARRVDVDYPSHTRAVERLRSTIAQDLGGIRPRPPRIPVYSTLTGGPLGDVAMDADYWFRNLRHPVNLIAAVRAALAEGADTFLEVSPHPVVLQALQEIAADAGTRVRTSGLLVRDHGGTGQMLCGLTQVGHLPGARSGGAVGSDVPLPAVPGSPCWLPPGTGQNVDRGTIPGTPTPDTAAGAASLLRDRVELPDGRRVAALAGSPVRSPWLVDHGLRGDQVVPGTALIGAIADLAEPTGRQCVAIGEVLLTHRVPVTPHCEMVAEQTDGEGRIETTLSMKGDQWFPVARGRGVQVAMPPGPTVGPVPPESWPGPDEPAIGAAATYQSLAARGYDYGPAFRGLQRWWRRDDEIFAEIALTGPPADQPADRRPHPALLDACVHAAVAALGPGTMVPFSWHGVTIAAATRRTLRARIRLDGATASVDVRDPDGTLVFACDRLTFRELPHQDPPCPADTGEKAAPLALEQTRWHKVTSRLPAGTPLGEIGEIGEVLPSAETDLVLRVPDVPEDDSPALMALAEHALAAAHWTGRDAGRTLTLLTTAGAQVDLGASCGGPAAGLVHGLVLSCARELVGRIRVLDLAEGDALLPALDALPDAESHPLLAIRRGIAFAPVLEEVGDGLPLPEHTGWRLDVAAKGFLDSIAAREHDADTRALRPHEVRIDVLLAGVNFRDIASGLALVPTELTMGSEGCGRIREVGPAVSGFEVGDVVYGVFSESFAPRAVSDHRAIRHLPKGWSRAQAAGFPIAAVTAYHCLVDVASLGPGERILVHTATGGVGLAAIQIARARGAEVFATASPPKQWLLRSLGLDNDHIASSRDLAFAERFRDSSGGHGMDVVLNSLTGAALEASLSLLAEGGRFVEMGKTDNRDAGQVAKAWPGVRYAAYNILGVSSESIGTALAALEDLATAGQIGPLPVHCVDVPDLGRTLTELRRARHTGKFVLRLPHERDVARPVLVVSGTRGLGLLAAEQLVADGQRHVVLTSRAAATHPQAHAAVTRLLDLGATTARVITLDVTSPDPVRAAIEDLDPALVIVAAGALQDALLPDQTPRHLHTTLRPKLLGSLNVLDACAGRDTRVVLFSSIAGTVGTIGQANYAAANAALDALARSRRARGEDVISVAWGLWRTTTSLTAHLNDRDRQALWTQHRIGLIETGVGKATLADILGRDLATAAAVDRTPPLATIDSSTAWPADPVPPDGSNTDGSDQAPRVALLRTVVEQTAQVLGYADPSQIPSGATFTSLGFDSLLSGQDRKFVGGQEAWAGSVGW